MTSDDLTLKTDYENLPVVLASLKNTAALEHLLKRPEVVAVGEDRGGKLFSVTTSRHLINAVVARQQNFRGQDTVIAIIDSGVDWTLSSLAFGPCLQGVGGADCKVLVSRDEGPDDGQRDASPIKHGTNVALIAAMVADQTKLLSYDIFDSSDSYVDSRAFSAINDIIARAGTLNIVAVNMSFGTDVRYNNQQACATDIAYNGVMYDSLVSDLYEVGIQAVVAAGNDAAPALPIPACVFRALSVGAVYDSDYGPRQYGPNFQNCFDPITAADQVTCFSNATGFLTMLAPGAFYDPVQGGPGALHGTSFAAPFVAGAIAVARGTTAFPNDGVQCTRRRLTTGGVPIADSRSGTSITYPRLDVLAAVKTPGPVGDCNADTAVTVDELIRGVNIALGTQNLQTCPSFDFDGSGYVDIAELISAINYATTGGCSV